MREVLQEKLNLLEKDIEQIAINHNQLLGAKAIVVQLMAELPVVVELQKVVKSSKV